MVTGAGASADDGASGGDGGGTIADGPRGSAAQAADRTKAGVVGAGSPRPPVTAAVLPLPRPPLQPRPVLAVPRPVLPVPRPVLAVPRPVLAVPVLAVLPVPVPVLAVPRPAPAALSPR